MDQKLKQEEKKKQDRGRLLTILVRVRDRLLLILPRVLSPIVVIAILAARAQWPTLLTDPITLTLMLAALLPWIAIFLKSAKIAGWEVEFQEIKKRQDQQQAQLNQILQFLVRGFVSGFELDHLRKLESDTVPFPFTQTWTAENFKQELVRLRTFGLIASKEGKFLHDMFKQQEANVKDYFFITDRGKKYLDYLRWLDKLEGLEALDTKQLSTPSEPLKKRSP